MGRVALELEAKILEVGPDNIACFFAEPVMGAGGVIMPPVASATLPSGASVATSARKTPFRPSPSATHRTSAPRADAASGTDAFEIQSVKRPGAWSPW